MRKVELRSSETGWPTLTAGTADETGIVVVEFEHEADAVCFREALAARLASFSLTLHPDKTHLIQFCRHAGAARTRHGLGRSEIFAFLGFTFACGRTLRSRFLLLRLMRRDCMVAKLKSVKEELRRRRHQPILVQGAWLAQVVSGFFNYHAVATNARALSALRDKVMELWRGSFQRRSQRDFTIWERMTELARDWRRGHVSSIHGPVDASTSNTQGDSRVPDWACSVLCPGGALRNERPYRDPWGDHFIVDIRVVTVVVTKINTSEFCVSIESSLHHSIDTEIMASVDRSPATDMSP